MEANLWNVTYQNVTATKTLHLNNRPALFNEQKSVICYVSVPINQESLIKSILVVVAVSKTSYLY